MKTIIYILSTVALVLICVVIFRNIKLKKDRDVLQNINNSLTEKTNTLSFYETNFEISAKLMGQELNDIKCESSEKNGSVDLKALIGDSPVFVCRYSDINCNVCIEAIFEQLNVKLGDAPDKVLVLCSYGIRRDFVAIKKINKVKFPIYKIKHEELNLLPEEYNVPYCFILNPNMTITYIHIPDKNFPHLNELYFDGIKRLLML